MDCGHRGGGELGWGLLVHCSLDASQDEGCRIQVRYQANGVLGVHMPV